MYAGFMVWGLGSLVSGLRRSLARLTLAPIRAINARPPIWMFPDPNQDDTVVKPNLQPPAPVPSRRRFQTSRAWLRAGACLAALALALRTSGAATAAAEQQAAPPNVILILLDDLGYADVGCYGAKNIRTPHIDRLAREGTRFTSFYVAQAVCTASRAAFLTGAYPNRIGLGGALNHTSREGLHPQEKLLSDWFKERGYATGIFGKWHLGHHPPFLPPRRGFDEWFGLPYSNDLGPLHPVSPGMPPLPLFANDKVIETDPDQSLFTRRFTEHAVNFIERNRARPFFIYLPHVMPHVPIFASAGFRGRSAGGLYGDVVEELDWSVGQILEALQRHGLDERTLVLFTSDNGPWTSYGDHAGSAGKLREGKLTTFEGGHRVPFLARWPRRVPAGRTSNELFTAMDLHATLVALIGATAPATGYDGKNLLPLLLGEPGAKGREEFWYYSTGELQAVRWQRWKLHLPHDYLALDGPPGHGGKPANYGKVRLGTTGAITNSGVSGIARRHGYRVEKIGLALFDLEADPGETTDVAGAHPDLVARLQRIAANARADLGDTLTGVAPANARPVGHYSAPTTPGPAVDRR